MNCCMDTEIINLGLIDSPLIYNTCILLSFVLPSFFEGNWSTNSFFLIFTILHNAHRAEHSCRTEYEFFSAHYLDLTTAYRGLW